MNAEFILKHSIIVYALTLFVIAAIIWASVGKITQATVATGQVIPSSEVKLISNRDGGELKELLVREGELVHQNQIIAILNDEDYKSQLMAVQKSYELGLKEVTILQMAVKKGLTPEIDLLRAERNINDIYVKIVELKNSINNCIIKSPVTGIVKKIHINTIGEAIAPAANMMEIVPLDDYLLIEAKVRPADIAFIHAGQEANIKLTAYDSSIYGSLKGVVTYISADTIIEGNNRPEAYYIVRVRTTSNFLENKKLKIIPGMIADVFIKTGERTVMQYLLKPLIKAKTEAFIER